MDGDTQNNEQRPFSETHHGHVGPILGALLIVLVLILGGLYLWGSMLSQEATVSQSGRNIPNNEPETPRADADKQILNTVSSSNDLDAIETDLASTVLESAESELSEIDRELERSAQ